MNINTIVYLSYGDAV